MSKTIVSGMMSMYRASAITLSDNDGAALGLDVNGNLLTSLATLLAGEDLANDRLKVEQRFNYFTPITTQTTTIVASGAGFLHNIIIPTPVASGVVTFYDNILASGNQLIPPITLPATLVSDGPIIVPFDVSFNNGLTIVTSGATMGIGGSIR